MNETRCEKLNQLLRSSNIEFICEAHNGLSARIAEDAGFKGIWASGLTISASLGVRDSNEASWTQVLEVVEFMCDATNVPILLDADTGYGNFNNVRRLVKKVEQRGVAGICIEDKLFPKTNSFIDGDKQKLACPKEFAGKIKAAKDTQADEHFCVIARTEAFIAGWGLEEALKRAGMYADAGADAVLIHSRRSKPDEVLSFMDHWQRDCPVVIVPTTYFSTPTEVFANAGISLVIWANHQVRAAIKAMQAITEQLFKDKSLLSVEDEVAPLEEIFRLQGVKELKQAERLYLPEDSSPHRAIILAASRGSELGELTADRPKSMVPINGTPLLELLVNHFKAAGVGNIQIVAGYCQEAINLNNVNKIVNSRYDQTKELASLACAKEFVEGTTLVSFGDILFKKSVLQSLLNEPGDIVVVVDAQSVHQQSERYRDLVKCSRPYDKCSFDKPTSLLEMKPDLPLAQAQGEWIGLLKLSENGSSTVRAALDELGKREDFDKLRMKDLFNYLLNKGVEIGVTYINAHWLDLDELDNLSHAQIF